MKNFFLYALFIFFTSVYSYAQSTNCVNFSSVDQDSTSSIFQTNECVKIISNTTINDLKIGNSVVIEIPKNVQFNAKKLDSSSNQYVEFIVDGTLNFTEKLDVNANIKIVVNSGGKFIVGSEQNLNNAEFKSLKSTIQNSGTISLSVLDFGDNSENIIVNSAEGTINIKSNINIKGTTIFQNFGKLFIKGNYSNNSKSSFTNCGFMESDNGFNLGGGKVINSGIFINKSGDIDLGNATSYFENTGLVRSLGNMNNGNGKILNEGRFLINNMSFNGTMNGPSESNRTGFFYVVHKIGNPSNIKVGPNLVFRKINAIKTYSNYASDYPRSIEYKDFDENSFPDTDYTSVFDGNNHPNYINQAGNSINNLSLVNVKYGCPQCSVKESYKNAVCPLSPLRENICVKGPNVNIPGVPSSTGISTAINEKENWPQHVTNGQLVLSSASKGLVLTRTVPENINSPVVGMLIYDTNAKCVKMYSPRGWNCLVKTCIE